jgi:hypothetical protein
VSATLDQLRRYLGGLTVYLRNVGATVPEPTLDRYHSGEVGFELVAALPGPDIPAPATIELDEIWTPAGERYERTEYAYDLIEHPFDRRRAFHAHDTATFAARFGVLVHEHCEETLGRPTCGHYYGFPVTDGYEALDRLLAIWSLPSPLGCSGLRCIG